MWTLTWTLACFLICFNKNSIYIFETLTFTKTKKLIVFQVLLFQCDKFKLFSFINSIKNVLKMWLKIIVWPKWNKVTNIATVTNSDRHCTKICLVSYMTPGGIVLMFTSWQKFRPVNSLIRRAWGGRESSFVNTRLGNQNCLQSK